jgi:hypothetical protein
MFGLQAILFFSLTGFMLNHEDWFGFSEPVTTESEGRFPAEQLQSPRELLIVEELRQKWGASGALASIEIQSDEIRAVFKSPGRRFEAVIQRPDGQIKVSRESHGFSGRITELHRGEDSGPVWSFMIDMTAVVLVLTSLTGLTLWLLIEKWRKLGLLCLGTCAGMGAVIYYFFVP